MRFVCSSDGGSLNSTLGHWSPAEPKLQKGGVTAERHQSHSSGHKSNIEMKQKGILFTNAAENTHEQTWSSVGVVVKNETKKIRKTTNRPTARSTTQSEAKRNEAMRRGQGGSKLIVVATHVSKGHGKRTKRPSFRNKSGQISTKVFFETICDLKPT